MEQDEINFADLLDTVYFHRYLILQIAGAFTVIGLLYAIMATPIYKTDLLIQIESQDSATPTALSNIATLFGGKSEADAEIQILGSRLVISKAVDNLHLDFTATPRYFPLIGRWIARGSHGFSKPGLLGMGGYAWGNESIEVGTFNVPRSMEGKPLTVVSQENNAYQVILDGSDKELTGKVGVLLKAEVNGGSFELLVNKLDANPGTQFKLLHYSRQQAIRDLQGNLEIAEKVKQSDMLNVSLEGGDPEQIAEILNEVGAEYLFQNISRKSAEAEKTLHFLDQYIPKVKANLDTLEANTVEAKAARGVINESEEAKAVLQRLVDAKHKALELRAKREELLSKFTKAYPGVQQVDAQLSAVEADIANIEAQIRKMPAREQEVSRQERDVHVDTDTYSNLLQTAQQMRLMKEGSIGNVRIIDNAVAPERPIKPRRLRIVILFIAIGLAMGVFAAFIKRKMIGAVHDAHEIEERSGIKVMASIPFSDRQEELYKNILEKSSGKFVLEQIDPHDPAIEGLRSFRISLQFSMQEKKNNLVLITGASPGVGKSFISVNMAAVLAATGKRVLLVDLDMRKGYLNQYFGLPQARGLAEVVEGELPLDQALHREVFKNFNFIATGKLPKDPNVFMVKASLASLLERFSSEYDIVLLDSPPILSVADATILSGLVDTNILVAREGVTALSEISESAKRFHLAGSEITGILFNGIRPRPGYGYGYGYGKYRYSGYRYRYKSKN